MKTSIELRWSASALNRLSRLARRIHPTMRSRSETSSSRLMCSRSWSLIISIWLLLLTRSRILTRRLFRRWWWTCRSLRTSALHRLWESMMWWRERDVYRCLWSRERRSARISHCSLLRTLKSMLASSSKDFRIIESGRQSWMWLKHLYPRRDKCLRGPSVRWLKLLVFVKLKLPNSSRKKILFKILKDLLHSLRELMILISKRNLRRLESRNLREKKRSS